MKSIELATGLSQSQRLVDMLKVLALRVLHLSLQEHDVEDDVVSGPAKPKQRHDKAAKAAVVNVVQTLQVRVFLRWLNGLQALEVRRLVATKGPGLSSSWTMPHQVKGRVCLFISPKRFSASY